MKPTVTKKRLTASLVLALVAAFGLAACGGGSKGTNANTNTPTANVATDPAASVAPATGSSTTGTGTITIKNFKFSTATVKAGATVTVKNEDDTTHTVSANDMSFDTTVDGGASATFTAPTKPGTYAFHCNIHNFMTGTLVVQ
jgi:plastocyanin